MAKSPFSNREVIEGIQKGGQIQEHWIDRLYQEHYSLIYKAITKHKISQEEAIDAYSDAIVDFRRSVLSGSFRGDSSYFTYLYRIFFNKVFNALTKNQTKKLEWVYEIPNHLIDGNKDILKLLETNEAYERLILQLETLGEPCQSILLDSSYWGYSMEEIAVKNQFKDAATARSKKFHCLKKLQKIIQKTRL